MVADYLKRKGRIGAKVIVLDAKRGYNSGAGGLRPRLQGDARQRDRRTNPNATVQSVNASKSLDHDQCQDESPNAKVLNYIPNQRAGRIAQALALDSTGFGAGGSAHLRGCGSSPTST